MEFDIGIAEPASSTSYSGILGLLSGMNPDVAAFDISVNYDSASASNKKVTVTGNIKVPAYTPIDQLTYQPIRVNPLWTNALSVKGKITFSGVQRSEGTSCQAISIR
jgi:hypothetical protein